ncbi:MAG: hypothetical protein J0L88_05470 [Xanthomonadales bacterium]|nr:hypothetical protein [Xanthomonadales bacterium]
MRSMPRLALPSALFALVAAPLAQAQAVTWQVVAGKSASLDLPGFPAGSRSYSDILLADGGGALIGLRMTVPSAAQGYWARREGSWQRHAATGVSGATLGPGRVGGEAGHVFLAIDGGGNDAAVDGQRVFVARAGDPANTVGATRGIWRWNTQQNIEVARVQDDGALGPGLGANAVFNGNAFAEVRMAAAGRVLINADVRLPDTSDHRVLARHVPGQGNVPCAMRGSTDPALAPGLSAGDSFDTSWTLASVALAASGRAYGTFSTSGSRSGIWEVCNGAPHALVADDVSDALGPEIGVATASFVDGSFGTARPGEDGRFYFSARYRLANGQSSASGLFWHDGVANRPLALNDAAAVYGPHWLDATWTTFNTVSLMGAGRWAAFAATARTSGGTSVDGLWRVEAGGSPRPVALVGASGDYAPETGRTWTTFLATAVFANGAILLHARTNPNAEEALWLLEPGQAPRRVLVAGQVVAVPTTSGVVQDTVQSFSIDTGYAQYGAGADGWAGADGSALVEATLSSQGDVRLLGAVTRAQDLLFRNGFDP